MYIDTYVESAYWQEDDSTWPPRDLSGGSSHNTQPGHFDGHFNLIQSIGTSSCMQSSAHQPQRHPSLLRRKKNKNNNTLVWPSKSIRIFMVRNHSASTTIHIKYYHVHFWCMYWMKDMVNRAIDIDILVCRTGLHVSEISYFTTSSDQTRRKEPTKVPG